MTDSSAGEISTGAGMDVVIAVASNRYRCHLGRGCEVGQRPQVTPVPGTPHWLSGLVLDREQVIPIVDLARVLGISGADSAATRLLTLRHAGLCVGFLVDEVSDAADDSAPTLDLTNVAGALTDRLRTGLGQATASG